MAKLLCWCCRTFQHFNRVIDGTISFQRIVQSQQLCVQYSRKSFIHAKLAFFEHKLKGKVSADINFPPQMWHIYIYIYGIYIQRT